MGKNDVPINLRYTNIKSVHIKKRKAGSDINEAVAGAVHLKHKTRVFVKSWSIPGRPDFAEPSCDITAEQLSSLNAEAELQPVVDLQAQLDPMKKVVEQLAKKELLQFASVVQSRICRGKPYKDSKDAPTFAAKVDQHVKAFQPYVELTGICRVSPYADPLMRVAS